MNISVSLRSLAVVASLSVVSVLGFFAIVSAQTDDTPPGGGNSSTVYCPHLSQTMQRGARDANTVPPGQVTELQHFLSDYYDVIPDDILTGYFGRLTQMYVRQFQREQGLPSFGIVGVLTRAAIARVCGTTTPPPDDLSCTFNGQTVQHNRSITAYLKQFVGDEEACQSETRTCQNGRLSGSYQYAWCSHMNPGTASNFTATPLSGTAPLSVMFRASLATALLASEYSVDFGDGASGTMNRDGTACTNADTCGSPAPSIFVPHSYPTAGTYTATLYHNYHVGGPSGPNAHVAVATATITVTAPQTTAVSVTTDFANYPPGGRIRAMWNNFGTVGIKDWIGTVLSGQQWLSTANLGQGKTWEWINGVSGGFAYLEAPPTNGSYQLVYFKNTTDGSAATSQEVGRSATFVVSAVPSVTLTINGQSAVTVAPGSTFTVAWSSSNATSCNLTNASGQTNSTAPNVSGSSQGAAPAAGTTFTYTLACTNSGGTTTKTATITGQTVVATNVGACVFRGQASLEGTTKTIRNGNQNATISMTCDNGAWIDVANGAQVCSGVADDGQTLTAADLGCSGNPISHVSPRHGKAPLSVTISQIDTGIDSGSCWIYDLAWGDGTTVVVQPAPLQDRCGSYYSSSYTYKAPGSFVISLQRRNPDPTHNTTPPPQTANIRVDP